MLGLITIELCSIFIIEMCIWVDKAPELPWHD